MIHVFPRWSFGYLLQAKPKHTAAGHEVIYVTCAKLRMKTFIYILILSVCIACSPPTESDNNGASEEISQIATNDSLICHTTLISTHPFESDSMIYIQMQSMENVELHKEVYINRHVENTFDTVLKYSFNNSHVSFYQTESELWVIRMDLNSTGIKTKFGFGVGDKFSSISDCQSINSNTRQFVLSETEGLTSISFELENGIVTNIMYSGYND